MQTGLGQNLCETWTWRGAGALIHCCGSQTVKNIYCVYIFKKNQHQRFVIVIVQVLWPSEGELEVFGETFHFLNSVKVLEVKIRSVLNGWLLNQDKDPNTH